MATQPVDGRKGADSLIALARDVLGHDPLSGHLFIFFSRRCDRVRIVYWDRNGIAMWTKRLEKGRYRPALDLQGICHLVRSRLRNSRSSSRGSISPERGIALDGNLHAKVATGRPRR